MKIVQNPVATCDQVYALIQSLTSQIRKRMEDPKSAGEENTPSHCYQKLYFLAEHQQFMCSLTDELNVICGGLEK